MGCTGSSLLHRLSLVAVRAALHCRLLIVVASLVAEHRLKSMWGVGSGGAERGLRSHGAQAQLWYMGLVALWPVGSSGTREQTGVPCIARWIVIPWATREALHPFSSKLPEKTYPLYFLLTQARSQVQFCTRVTWLVSGS